MPELPTSARVVIIGGGISGCSVAYHLAALGWTDILLLERRQLTCGTTWHAAGLVGQLRASQNMTRLAKYSADLYVKLEAETGVLVTNVEPDSPAAKAGVSDGDLIVELDGKPVASIDDLLRLMTDERVGVTIPLTVIRRTEKVVLEVTPAATRRRE